MLCQDDDSVLAKGVLDVMYETQVSVNHCMCARDLCESLCVCT